MYKEVNRAFISRSYAAQATQKQLKNGFNY